MCGVERWAQGCQEGAFLRCTWLAQTVTNHTHVSAHVQREHISQLVKLFEPRALEEHLFSIIKITKWPEQAISSNLPTAHVFYFYFYRSSSLWSFLWFLSSVLLHYVYSLLQNIPRAVFLHLTWQFSSTDVTLKAQTTKYLLKDSTLLPFFSLGRWHQGRLFCFSFSRRAKRTKRGWGHLGFLSAMDAPLFESQGFTGNYWACWWVLPITGNNGSIFKIAQWKSMGESSILS